MSQELPPAPLQFLRQPERDIHTREQKEFPEKIGEYSDHFLGMLLTESLQLKGKNTTLLDAPTKAYEAIGKLWLAKREGFAADKFDGKLKQWADARAEAVIEIFTTKKESLAQPADIFKSSLGFTIDQTASQEEQIQQFSIYLQGPFYQEYCGEYGIEHLADKLTTPDIRALHDFLAPILGGEEQFKRLEACQLARYRVTNTTRHPLTSEAAQNDELTIYENDVLLIPMRDILVIQPSGADIASDGGTINDSNPSVSRDELSDGEQAIDTLDDPVESEDDSGSISIGEPHLVEVSDESLTIHEVIEMNIEAGKVHVMHGDILHTPANAIVYQTDPFFNEIPLHDSRSYLSKKDNFTENQWVQNQKIAEGIGSEVFDTAKKYFNKHAMRSPTTFLPVLRRGAKAFPFGYAEVFKAEDLHKQNNLIDNVIFFNNADKDELIDALILEKRWHDTSNNVSEVQKLLNPWLKNLFYTADKANISSLGMPIIGLDFLFTSQMRYKEAIVTILGAYRDYQQEKIRQGKDINVKDIYLVVDELADKEHIDGSLSVMQNVAQLLQN